MYAENIKNPVKHLWRSYFGKITRKLGCSTGFYIRLWHRFYSRKGLQNVNIYLIWSKSTLKICHCLLVSWVNKKLFHDGGLYHKEISPLICSANERTSFYMIGTSVMNELTKKVEFAVKFSVATYKHGTIIVHITSLIHPHFWKKTQ